LFRGITAVSVGTVAYTPLLVPNLSSVVTNFRGCAQTLDRASKIMSTEIAAEYPHLSPATLRDNDINYPPILVLLIGLISSFICGVLNFGQGMAFAVLWNMSKRLNLLDYNTSFSKGIMYGQILSLFALIPVLAVGWREVFKLIGYSSIMLGIMNYVREEFLRHGEFCLLCFAIFHF
jgi:hypothetical protein